MSKHIACNLFCLNFVQFTPKYTFEKNKVIIQKYKIAHKLLNDILNQLALIQQVQIKNVIQTYQNDFLELFC